MIISYYEKYLKYKKKYQKRIVSDYNNLLDKWKKIGFPYAKHYIDEKTIFNNLVNYAQSLDRNFKTYVIYDNQGLIHDRIRQILNNITCDGVRVWKELDINNENVNYVDFAWIGATIGDNYLKYDKRIYEVKTKLKNLLEGGGVKGDTNKKDVITNKSSLYFNLKELFPELCKKYMMNTTTLREMKKINNNKVYIIRPIGPGAGGGADVYVVSNNEELEKARQKTRRYNKTDKHVIISEYIINPLIIPSLSNKKFHLRMYLMICVGSPYKNGYEWHFWDRGKIITAELPYKDNDYSNTKIHDTHFKSTPINKYFPEDLGLSKEITDKIYLQMEEIMEGVSSIIKDNAFSYEESKYAFEVFGVDFMITDEYSVKLLEVNARHDYGVNDMKKERKDKFIDFCSDFYDWIYQKAILPVFPEKCEKNNYISNEKYRLDREKFPVNEDIRFNGKYISIFVPLEDFNTIDIIIDYFTEEARIKAQRNNSSPSLYDYFYKHDLLKRALKLLISKNININYENLRDSFYNFKEVYQTSAESTIFYITMWKILFSDISYENFKDLKILDGAAGYGTRLLTSIIYNCYYTSIDPNSLLTDGFNKLINTFGNSEKQIVYLDGLPDSIPINNIPDNSQNLVWFSPPMFDGEIYSNDDKQSINLFNDFDTWKNKFLYKSLQILWNKLKPNGYIVFQSIRYNLIREYIQKLKDAKFMGVIARKTYGGRFKPNWIWKKLNKLRK